MFQFLKNGVAALAKKNWSIIAACTLVLALALAVLGCGITTWVRHDGTLNVDILTRVLHVRIAGRPATAFTIEVDGSQYLITAAHLTRWRKIREIEIWSQGWRRIQINVVGIAQHPADIMVLAADGLLTPVPEIEVGSGGMKHGQDVRFLGFPLGLGMNIASPRGNVKLPLVKGGLLSGWGTKDNAPVLLVDGHNNGGFSGGPVIFSPLDSREQIWKIASVVWGYEQERVDVIDDAGQIIGKAKGNSGILLVSRIETALALIEANPIGFPVARQ